MKITYKTAQGLKTIEPSLFNETHNLRQGGGTFEWYNALSEIAKCHNNYPIVETYEQVFNNTKTLAKEMDSDDFDTMYYLSYVFKYLSSLKITNKDKTFFISLKDVALDESHIIVADSEEQACKTLLEQEFKIVEIQE